MGGGGICYCTMTLEKFNQNKAGCKAQCMLILQELKKTHGTQTHKVSYSKKEKKVTVLHVLHACIHIQPIKVH